jgi:hypothetical protein
MPMRRRVLKVLIVCSIVLGLFVNVRADECDVLLNFLLEFATDADKAFDKMVDLRNADPELVPKIQHILSIATEDQRAKNIEQLLANRTLGDAQVIFTKAADFDDNTLQIMAKAATLRTFDREAGESISKLLGSFLTKDEKVAALKDLDVLMSRPGGPIEGDYRMLDKVGLTASSGNRGGQFELKINATLVRGDDPELAVFGQPLSVDADWSGKGGPPLVGPKKLIKIDTRTSTHGLQMKSRTTAPFDPIELNDGISFTDLQVQVDECRQEGIRPVLVSNAEFGAVLTERVNNPSDPIYANGLGLGIILLVTK